jgi:hypothetical protein
MWPRECHHRDDRPPPRDRVQTVSRSHRPSGADRPGRACDLRQLLHPQDPAIQGWLLAHPRFQLHFTPTYSSWLNLVERFIAELTTKWLKRGTHPSVPELEQAIQAWIDTWNDNPRPFVWTKTADQILDTIAHYCQRTNDSGH